ncbi:MAG TPA: hypothetical protein VLV76_21555 [Candidatus Acidoferrum sp.]|nr:hypothetical protein [Candidatus Acidoferrum sp.]
MTQAISAAGGPLPPLPVEAQPRPAPAPEAASTLSLPETRAAARHNAETAGRYQVQIHAETMRIITEVVDMQTGDVLMYFPPGYRPDAQPARSDGEKGADAGER